MLGLLTIKKVSENLELSHHLHSLQKMAFSAVIRSTGFTLMLRLPYLCCTLQASKHAILSAH